MPLSSDLYTYKENIELAGNTGGRCIWVIVSSLRIGLHYCTLITDAGLQKLENLPALEELSLRHCDLVTDALGCKRLGGYRHSNFWCCAAAVIKDVGLLSLEKMLALGYLNLKGWKLIMDAVWKTSKDGAFIIRPASTSHSHAHSLWLVAQSQLRYNSFWNVCSERCKLHSQPAPCTLPPVHSTSLKF